MENILVEIEFYNAGTIKLELYPEIAPQSVYNFVELARNNFYDNLIMHRVIAGFVAQGGDPTGSGKGGPGYNIKGEFASNGHENSLTHKKGAISWARSAMPDSAGSQFYIALDDIPFLDGDYAAFGYMVEGSEVLDYFNSVATSSDDRPMYDEAIKTVRVLTDVELPKPEKL